MKFKIIIVLFVLVVPFLGNAQIVPPPIPPPPPPGLPIDGFSSLLVVAGLIYGSKKIFKDSSS